MSDRRLDEERIFQVARRLGDDAALSEYLDQVCAGDSALRRRVEELLRVHEQEQSFLQSQVASTSAPDGGQLKIDTGQRIGRYKLLQKIGEGGFGVVFMAEQGRPVRRKVALKVIKPGMDSQAVVARFEAERQALAMMDHPHIARVFDGGATESGRPYFVMELVKGVPVTEFCDKNQFSTIKRLVLFATVCQAVQHAHQKGIIHRDLKPSNVLVTLADGEPIVKVIDFGVAKATNQQLTEKTLFTAFGQMVGTPQYMSPEQAEMSCLDVDTRSDVYSLGVLLYELLTSTTPLEAERLRTASYAEMQRLIKEEEAPPPSTRLSTSGEKLTAIAQHRSVSPEKLKHQIKGDLDWIVMKSLEKRRNRRYASPGDLATDVFNYLGNQPVVARPPTLGYRASKYLRRNRVAIAVVGLTILLLSLGLAGTTWQAAVALAARERSAELLRFSHNALIERGLQQAFVGELKEVQSTIGLARESGVSEDWLKTLEGVAHFHRGDFGRAIVALEAALQEDETSVSALAMLSLAYFLNGDWEKWSAAAYQTQHAKPREQYDEFDRLFLGYGWFYIDLKTSIEFLEPVLKEHRTWYIPRAVLAIALAHQARWELTDGNAEKAKESLQHALEETRVPQVLGDDNAFVLGRCFYVYATAVELLDDPDGALQSKAEALLAQLEARHRDYAVGSLLRATYYEKQESLKESKAAWQDMLAHGRGTLLMWPAATLSDGDDKELLSQLEGRGRDGDVATAYLLALSRDPNDRKAAMEVFRQQEGDYRSWSMRHTLIQIPLLAGYREEARRICQRWVAEDDEERRLTIDTDSMWLRECVHFVAGDLSALSEEAKNPGEVWFFKYQRGMLAMARGAWEEALQDFNYCNKNSYYPRGGFRRFWTRVLEKRAEQFRDEGLQRAVLELPR